ncbi:hypothetical protein GWK47_023580 [Chionoecetes opilio]|uniref:Uncharacterized protein n=1 Tax=Chionoecetes opilio TaxID=41210 RepID=A0A8J5BTW5_CHIOP|nr:hypothetical protein GWK47_023580 [Chionoecetes opilio]
MTNAGSVAAPAGNVTGTTTATSFVIATVSIPNATAAAAVRVSSAVVDVTTIAAAPGTGKVHPSAVHAAWDDLDCGGNDPRSRSAHTAAASVAASVLTPRDDRVSSPAHV